MNKKKKSDKIDNNSTTKTSIKKENIKSFLITIFIFACIYGISLFLSFFIIPTVRIYDNSMLPGLNDRNIIMLLKTNNVKKGDVVAVYKEDKMLIKRCVGIEGDIINIDSDGNLYVNDKLVKEEYLNDKSLGKISVDFPYTVKANHIFILSDDRNTYSDSRNILIDSINVDDIYGKALIKLYPIKDIGIIK